MHFNCYRSFLPIGTLGSIIKFILWVSLVHLYRSQVQRVTIVLEVQSENKILISKRLPYSSIDLSGPAHMLGYLQLRWQYPSLWATFSLYARLPSGFAFCLDSFITVSTTLKFLKVCLSVYNFPCVFYWHPGAFHKEMVFNFLNLNINNKLVIVILGSRVLIWRKFGIDNLVSPFCNCMSNTESEY